ncbi:hypothetical protein E2493_14060 [Sphingomonas parva]|uniref:Lipoprotein n=1 Tax=Sphingomonas parva TaxID=2555898 RepID=A0A4Y8ZNV3_9SPHN|nr:DUF6491 family protein [Sphingomonas parva]TFI57644.1 hypothetical protein E2493_14060 [Sphingomonas parva]
MRHLPFLCVLPLLAGCTASSRGTSEAATDTGARQCFWASEVTSFSDAGPDRALVSIGRRETWALDLAPGCPEVDYAMRIGIVSRGSERICSGANAELVVPTASGRGAQRCLVRAVRRLSPEEAAAARGEPQAR